MRLLKKRTCARKGAVESHRKKAKKEDAKKLRKIYQIESGKLGSDKFLLQKYKTELRNSQILLATCQKMVDQRQKNFDKQSHVVGNSSAKLQEIRNNLNGDVVTTVKITSGNPNNRKAPASRQLEPVLEKLMVEQEKSRNTGTRNGLQARARELGCSLHLQAREKSCVPTSMANLIQLIVHEMGLLIRMSMLIELMTDCCKLDNTGSTIQKVISEVNIFMSKKKKMVYATDNQDGEVEIRFQLVLRAEMVDPKLIAAFARTENARRNLFLVYQRMSPTVLHALVAQGEGNGTKFTVQDSFPNTRGSIPVKSVDSCFLVDVVEIYTRDVLAKNAPWVEVKNPAVSYVPMHWTVPPAP